MEDDVKQASTDRYAVSQAYRWKAERDAAMQELRQLKEEVEGRLMPKGMEWLLEVWPKYESGEFVKFGDELEHKEQGHRFKVDGVEFMADGWRACYESGGVRDVYHPGERVKRPAKVLDADGAEIRVGDEVWSTAGEFDGKRTVKSIHVDDGEPPYALFNERSEPWSCLCCNLTHRAPVLAADGKPLREGETVWSVDSGTRYTVEKITDELIPIKCCSEMGSTVSLHPSQLTHERPESWERLEEDADITASLFDAFDSDASADIRDLVRRAKKLAEKEG